MQLTSEQMLSRLQNEYGTSQFAQGWQKQDWTYWDQVYVPTAGTRELQFFAVPAGGTDPNGPAGNTKPNEYTNIQQSKQIGGAECFVVQSLHFDLFPAPKARQSVAAVAAQTTFSADQLRMARWLQNMSNQGVFTWEINKNTWMEETMPWLRFPPGFGLGEVIPPAVGGTGAAAVSLAGTNAYCSMSQFSVFDMGDIFTLDQPMFLAPNTPFTYTIGFPQAASTALTNIYNGAGTAHDQTGTAFAYAEMRGIKVRPLQ